MVLTKHFPRVCRLFTSPLFTTSYSHGRLFSSLPRARACIQRAAAAGGGDANATDERTERPLLRVILRLTHVDTQATSTEVSKDLPRRLAVATLRGVRTWRGSRLFCFFSARGGEVGVGGWLGHCTENCLLTGVQRYKLPSGADGRRKRVNKAFGGDRPEASYVEYRFLLAIFLNSPY